MRRRTIILSTILAAVIGFITIQTPRVTFMRAMADELPGDLRDQSEKLLPEDLPDQLEEKELPQLPDKPLKDIITDELPANISASKATTYNNIPLVDNNLMFISTWIAEEWCSRTPSSALPNAAATYLFPGAFGVTTNVVSNPYDFQVGPFVRAQDPDNGIYAVLTEETRFVADRYNGYRIFIFDFLYSEEAETEEIDYKVIVYVSENSKVSITIDSILPNPINWYWLTSIQVLDDVEFDVEDTANGYASPIPFCLRGLDQNNLRDELFYIPSYVQIYRSVNYNGSKTFGGDFVVMQTAATSSFALNQTYGSVSYYQQNTKIRYNGADTSASTLYMISPDQPFSLNAAFVYDTSILYKFGQSGNYAAGSILDTHGFLSRYGTLESYAVMPGGYYVTNSNVDAARPAFRIFSIAPITATIQAEEEEPEVDIPEVSGLQWDSVGSVLQSFGTIIVGSIGGAGAAISGFFFGIGRGIARGYDFRGVITHAGSTAGQFAATAWNLVHEFFFRTAKPIGDFVQAIIEGIAEILMDIITWIGNTIGTGAENWNVILALALGLGVFFVINRSQIGGD